VLQVPHFTRQNYQEVRDTKNMTAGFVNSLLISVPSPIFPVLIAALAAFAFA